MNKRKGITTVDGRGLGGEITTDAYKFSLVKRWQAVKDLLPHLIVEDSRVYVITSMADPWGSRSLIRWSQLEEMIMQAEAKLIEKKEVSRAGEIHETVVKKDQRA